MLKTFQRFIGKGFAVIFLFRIIIYPHFQKDFSVVKLKLQ
jgi:hypothetical protein